MRVKRMVSFFLVVMLFVALYVPANALVLTKVFQSTEGEVSISPQWTNVNDITLDLYFENSEAGCSGKIRALSGTTKITAVFKLERKSGANWILEKSWNQSSSTNSLSFFSTDVVAAGYTYRLSVTADVTRSVTETVSASVQKYY